MICLLVLMLAGCRRETAPDPVPETDRTVSAAEMPEIPMSGICLQLMAVEWEENGGFRYTEELTLVYDMHRNRFGMYSRPAEQ